MCFADATIVYLYSYFPAILLGLFFWWMDRFERESLLLVALAFLWGGFGAVLLSFFWNTFFHVALLVNHQDKMASEMISSVLMAPLVEEFTKGLLILILLRLNKVDNVTDGILLGILVGLGFAATENVYYAQSIVFPSSGELAMWDNLWFREIHNTLLHASSTALWGVFIGYSHYFKGIQKHFILLNGYVLALVTHGVWNFLASFMKQFSDEFPLVEVAMRLELFVVFGGLFVLFLVSVKKESKIIVRELIEEVERGVIPLEHVEYFASLVRHSQHYRLPQKVKHREYASQGVKLALRKHRYRHNPSLRLQQEIENLREGLRRVSEYCPDSLQLRYGST